MNCVVSSNKLWGSEILLDCAEKRKNITSNLASLSLMEISVFNLVDNELRFNVLEYCMVKIEIRMKILTLRKQLGDLK